MQKSVTLMGANRGVPTAIMGMNGAAALRVDANTFDQVMRP